MNRRQLLGVAAGAISTAALAGCVERLEALELSTPVLVNIENHTDVERNVAIRAYELDADRQTYDESVSVPTEGTTNLGHISNAEQQVEVELFEPGATADADGDPSPIDEESTFIGDDTQSLLVIITEDGLELELSARGDDESDDTEAASNETTTDDPANESADTNSTSA